MDAMRVTIPLTIVVAILSIALANEVLQDYSKPDVDGVEELRSRYLTQNLKGDTVDTWLTWRIPSEERTFHIHIQRTSALTEERKNAIYDVIMSEEKMEIPDSLMLKGAKSSSTYYLGWKGAVNSIEDKTMFTIPKMIHFHVTDYEEGDVIIHLYKVVNKDGFTGSTTSLIDEATHQIVKSDISIFNVENLSINQLQAVVRHELGHAFGLAHSTADEDLMHPTIVTPIPYISPCDLDALTKLYNGSSQSKVICEK